MSSDTNAKSLPGEAIVPGDADLGARYNPFVQPQMDDPYPILSRARASAPVFFCEALRAWVVTRFRLVQDILQDTKNFRSGGLEVKREHPAEVQAILDELPRYVPMLPMVDAPEHTPRRRLTQGAVSPKRVSQLEGSVRAIVNRLIDSFYTQGKCDFYDAFAYPYPLAVVSSLLGLPDSVAEKLHYWAGCRVALVWGEMDLEASKNAARGSVDFQSYIEAQVISREKEPRDDVISDMLEINRKAAQPVSFAEIVEEIQGIVVAGHETTANWVTMTLYHLLSNPCDWAKILADRSAIPQMLEESLRFDGPVSGLWRRTAAEVVVGGVTIPAGGAIFCSLGSANRDETIFADAEHFVGARPTARQHIMFGRGPHTCVGASLARLEGRIAFEVLTERMPRMRLAQSRLSFGPNAVLRQPKALLLEWDV
jgi:cytochrome P450